MCTMWNNFYKIKWDLKGDISIDAETGPPRYIGMYFDAVIVLVTNFSLLFKLVLDILCTSKIELYYLYRVRHIS